MSNTRHIANKPLDWEVQPRPFRPDPDPGPPPSPEPPPPPPPPPETYQAQDRVWLSSGRQPTIIITGATFIRFAVHFTLYSESGFPTNDVLAISSNFSDLYLYDNCSNFPLLSQRVLLVGGPDYNTVVNPEIGPLYIVLQNGYMMINHIALMYSNVGGSITVCGLNPRLRQYNACHMTQYTVIDGWYSSFIGSGLWGFSTGGTHFVGRSYTQDNGLLQVTGYSYFPRTERGDPIVPPTELQKEQFRWLWERTPDVVL